MSTSRLLLLFPFLVVAACNDGGDHAQPQAPMVLAAGLETLDPVANDTISARVDMGRVELGGLYAAPSRTYELTTPAGVPFAFDVLTMAEGNTGWVQVSVAHLLDGTATPTEGVMSLAAAGVIVSGPGLFIDGRNTNWLVTDGSGFSRLSVRGQIERTQVFAFETTAPIPGQTSGESARQTALVEVKIGPASPINSTAATGTNHPGIVDDDLVYTSDAWRFGMPAIAVSGDRSSVVVYEGDRQDPFSANRYEMRLQQDKVTGAVTGGGSLAVGLDSGNWRDHEIAALYNVLAVAQGRDTEIELRLSFDRGATFTQTEVFAGVQWGSLRLVQIAMAADYSVALVYWLCDGIQQSQLMLVDGRASAFDTGGSPTAFTFAAPVAIHTVNQNVVPLPMGMQWSDGGDLVIGHAYSFPRQGTMWGEFVTEFHCAIRPWQGEWRDLLVDSEIMIARDPSVALLGSGQDLRVYYAYESQAGISLVRLAGGQVDTQSLTHVGSRGAHAPSVFAREVSGAVRVDLFYIADAGRGLELHASRWQAFGGSPEEHFRLSTSSMTPTVLTNPQMPYGFRIRQLGWFGYDAVRDGNEIVLVIDEEQYDCMAVYFGVPRLGGIAWTGSGGPLSSPGMSPAAPPPLAPGMTQPVPTVNSAHRHQLRIVRLQ
ncbi:MAG TPA: hypothetical protein VF384_01740 [Planctomycetota bacterium]